MDLVLALVIGLLVGYGLSRQRRRPQEEKPEPSVAAPERPEAPPHEEPAVPDLYTLAAQAHPYFQQTAHPKDLLGYEDFEHGVGQLCEARYTMQDLLAYATGEHILIACMALEALHRREDTTEEVVPPLVGHLARAYVWPIFFLLRVLAVKCPTPIVGAVVAEAQEWWPQNSVLLQVLRAFLEAREDREVSTLSESLDGLTGEQVGYVEALLYELGEERTALLLAELWHWQRTRVDVAFLKSVGRVWMEDDEAIVEHEALKAHLKTLRAALLKTPRRSVLLVGPPGVGKTALTQVLGAHLRKQGWTLFEAGASDVLAGQIYIGELEGRVQQLVKQVGQGRRVLWVVPRFHDLLYAGRHRYSPVSVLDMLLPFIESGDLVVVGETQPKAYERLLQAKPRLRVALETMRLEPLPEPEAQALAQQWVARQEAVTIGERPLREAFQLAKQYLGDKAAPGNLLHFLKLTQGRLLSGSKEARALTTDDLLVTLSALTGLPTSILDERQGLDLEALEALFKQRVMGQQEAVACLVERVAMIKAGLTDPTRPSGVFLFVGPTGTGKTEIAKTLAEFLFGSSDRMIRLDMSEFQTVDSLDRLLGETDQTSDGVALVNMIRKQPFSVVLLDEFEKAHRNVWDLFLQVFDDGRLTDRQGNTADFRHGIIILTSNLGAMVPQGASIGFGAQKTTFSPGGVLRIVRQAFRPEFINRLDRVVVFRPLSRSVMRNILYKELDTVLQRRGLRTREWAVEWEDTAVDFLLEKGFTADLGARPLKRAIEQYLLSPLALTIVTHQFPEGDQFLFVRSDGKQLKVEFVDPDIPEGSPPQASATVSAEEGSTLEALILDADGARAEVVFLQEAYEVLQQQITSTAWEARKQAALEQMSTPDFWDSPDRFGLLGDIEYMDRLEAGFDTASSLLQRLQGSSSAQRAFYPRDLVRRLAQQLYLLEAAHASFVEEAPRDAFLVIEADPDAKVPADQTKHFARRLSQMYRQWAEKRRMRYEVLQEDSKGGHYTFMMAVSGFGAFSLLESEEGLHVFEIPKDEKSFRRAKVRVRIAPQPLAPAPDTMSPLAWGLAAFEADKAEAPLTIVRRYREAPSPLVRDSIRHWRTGRLDRVLEGDFDVIT